MGALQTDHPHHSRQWFHASRTSIGSIHDEYGTACQDVAITTILPSGISLHAVLDGHGPLGDIIASEAAQSLLTAAADRLHHVPCNDLDARHRALSAAFAAAAEAVDANQGAVESGTTATLVAIGAGVVTVANVGDSAVVWARAGRVAEIISRNHRTVDLEERDRVQRAGGVVRGEYLSNGDLGGKVIAVTRALGDLDVRAVGVVSTPHVRHVELEGTDDFLIIATDGLWDAHGGIPPQQSVDIVRMVFTQMPHQPAVKEACDELLSFAKGTCRLPIDDFAVIVLRQLAPS